MSSLTSSEASEGWSRATGTRDSQSQKGQAGGTGCGTVVWKANISALHVSLISRLGLSFKSQWNYTDFKLIY